MVHQPARAEAAHVPPILFLSLNPVSVSTRVQIPRLDAPDQRQRPQARPRRVRADAVTRHVHAPRLRAPQGGVRRRRARHELARGGGGDGRGASRVRERYLPRAPRVGDGRAVLLGGPDQHALGRERRDVRRPEDAGRAVRPAVFGDDGHELDDVPPLQLRGQKVAFELTHRPGGGAARDDHGVVRVRCVQLFVPLDGCHAPNLHRRRASRRRLARGRQQPRGVPERREVTRRVKHQALGDVQCGGHRRVSFLAALLRRRPLVRARQRTRSGRVVAVVAVVAVASEKTSRRLDHLRRHVHPRDQPPQLLRGDRHTFPARRERQRRVLREVARLLQGPCGTTHACASRDGAPAARRNRRTRNVVAAAFQSRRRFHHALGVLRCLDQLERRGDALRATPDDLAARRVRV